LRVWELQEQRLRELLGSVWKIRTGYKVEV